MKKLFFLVVALSAVTAMQAQTEGLLLEEDFEYEASRPLVSDPVEGMDNLDPETGWSTAANSSAAISTFEIVEGNLTYPGYPGGQYGNALRYNGTAGQGVFKLFPEGICDDKDVYVAFLMKIENTNEEITGGDFLFGLKMEPQADSWNWGGRIYAKVDPAYPGEEISFGVQKLADCSIRWVNGSTGPFFPTGQTLLVVMRYHVGKVYGNSAEEEAGHFDDEVSFYVNPAIAAEPATPDIFLSDANAKDIYRWGTTRVFGSARGIYFRSADQGAIPAYIIDGIRVGRTWADIMGQTQGVEDIHYIESIHKTINEDGQIVIHKGTRRFSVLGTEL